MHFRKRRPGKTTTFTKRWKVAGAPRDGKLRVSERKRLGLPARNID